MKVIAHRGNKKYTPENTMAAFMSAESSLADGIEFDIQLTRDKVPVIIHDASIDRTTNGRGAVRNFTYRELCQFDAGVKFGESFKGEKIPSFRQLLNWALHTKVELHAELKAQTGDGEEFVNACLDDVEATGLFDRIVISTFQHSYLKAVKRRFPDLQTALLTKIPIFKAENYANKVNADAIHIRHSFQASMYYKRWVDRNIPVRVYRVLSAKDAVMCKNRRVSAVFTDDPAQITKILESTQ